jgi:CMP-N-acetylneuraminic acid synthetase
MNRQLGRTLALIPAKEGSRRLPAKNIRPLAGRSLLERAIVAARDAGIFDRICVSTESLKVAELARTAGAEVPFMRPPALACDPASVVDVSLHALNELENRGDVFQTLFILLPTSPFRTVQDILGARQCYLERGVNFLHSVVSEVRSPLSSMVLRNGLLEPLHPDWIGRTGAKANENTPIIVRANGAVSIMDVAQFRKEKTYYAYPLAAYEMPWERSIDIDDELDFKWAEFIACNVA